MNTARINTQSMDDNDYFNWLVTLMITNINFMSNLSKCAQFFTLKTWILDKTKNIFTNCNTTLGNRIFYIINDIHKFPCCRTCGKVLNVTFTAYSTLYDYEHCFCSSSCSVSDSDVRYKIEQTTLKNHGYKYSFEDPNTHIKAKQTILDRYGVEYPMQCKDIANKVASTNLDRYGCISPFGNKNVQEKSKATLMKNYGVDNPIKSPIIYSRMEETWMKNYGVDHPFKSKEIQQKSQITRLDRYGSTSYLGTEDCIAKTRRWALETYNVDHHLKAPEIRKEIEKTNLQTYGNKAGKAFGTQYFKDAMIEHYGVEYSMQCKEILDKARHRYIFNSRQFDSAPEIAFFIWLKDNNIEFEYQPNVSFEYEFAGKLHKYFPDFKVGDMFFEIKGDHFFKDSKMVCPYRDKAWSDERYEFECAKYEAKHQCMLMNDVVILKNAEYAMFVQYVKDSYGSNYLMQFKT